MKEPCVVLSEKALLHNFKELQKCAGALALAPVIKASAYGHGARLIAALLEENFSAAELPFFCVARVGEAKDLRAQGISRPILILSHFDEEDLPTLPSDCSLTLHSLQDLKLLLKVPSEHLKRVSSIHLNFNSGMNRLGIKATELKMALELTQKLGAQGLNCAGLLSHLARGEEDPSFLSHDQEKLFTSMVEYSLGFFEKNSVPRPAFIHLANSPGILNKVGVKAPFNLGRPGIHLWGVRSPTLSASQQLEAVLEVRAPIRQVFAVEAGEGVGYGHRFNAPKNSLIGTLCLGYADGIPRSLSRSAAESWKIGFVVEGVKVPIAGTVSMDLTMVDLSDHPKAELWRKALRSGEDISLQAQWICAEQSAAQIADALGSITYEIFCRLPYRLLRTFVRN